MVITSFLRRTIGSSKLVNVLHCVPRNKPRHTHEQGGFIDSMAAYHANGALKGRWTRDKDALRQAWLGALFNIQHSRLPRTAIQNHSYLMLPCFLATRQNAP